MNEDVKFAQADYTANKTNCTLMVFLPVLFFLPLVADNMKQSAYLKYFANQTLLVLISNLATNVCRPILREIPLIGSLLGYALVVLSFVLYVSNVIHALHGERKQIPLLGGINIIK